MEIEARTSPPPLSFIPGSGNSWLFGGTQALYLLPVYDLGGWLSAPERHPVTADHTTVRAEDSSD